MFQRRPFSIPLLIAASGDATGKTPMEPPPPLSPHASGAKRSREPSLPAAAAPSPSPSPPKGRRLTPREISRLALLAKAPELQGHRDARGRRRAVSVDTSQLISGALGSLVGESCISPTKRARASMPERDAAAAAVAAPPLDGSLDQLPDPSPGPSLDQMLDQPPGASLDSRDADASDASGPGRSIFRTGENAFR